MGGLACLRSGVAEFPVYSVGTLSGGRLVVSGGGGTLRSGIPNGITVLHWNGADFDNSKAARHDLGDVGVSLAVHKPTRRVYLAAGTRVQVFSCRNGLVEEQNQRLAGGGRLCTVAISANGKKLVVGDDDGPIHVMDANDLKTTATFSGHGKGSNDLDILPDASLVVSSGRDRKCHLWETAQGKSVVDITTPLKATFGRTAHIRCCKFVPDRAVTTIVFGECTAKDGGHLSLWQQQKGEWKTITRLRAFRDPISAMCVSLDGNFVAAASAEGNLVVVKVEKSGRQLERIWGTESTFGSRPVHKLPSTTLAFSADGQFLFSGSADATYVAVPVVLEPRAVGTLVLSLIAVILSLLAGFLMELPRAT